MLSNLCYSCLYLLTPSRRRLTLGVSVDYDEIEPVVETEDRLESSRHLPSGGRVQSPEIRGNHVKVATVALGYPRYVPSQRFVGGTICQKECARCHASVKEI
ncbi:MAG: hypothetical protein LC749_16350 [Actinobacteria bacterium]|nr:hypothetical protein [Actinomycetota bacterium]